jgi:hypothetical protein
MLKYHDIRHAYSVSSVIKKIFYHVTEIISKRHKVRHALKRLYNSLDMLESISDNIYSYVKMLFT